MFFRIVKRQEYRRMEQERDICVPRAAGRTRNTEKGGRKRTSVVTEQLGRLGTQKRGAGKKHCVHRVTRKLRSTETRRQKGTEQLGR
jgi:hypothetical protein